MAQQRPARLVSHNSQTGQAGLQTGQAGSSGSSSLENSKLRTFVPKRLEFSTWKSNEDKNKGKFVKRQCTFDRLMAKYKKEKADSQNRPLKKREPHLPSKMIDPSKWWWLKQWLQCNRELLLMCLIGVPRFRLPSHHNGALMGFGCHIPRRHLCITNKGEESLLVMIHDNPSLVNWAMAN